MSSLLDDLRLAARTSRRDLGVSLLAVAVLGLGLGAALTVFGMADAVLLRPFPFADQGRLIALWGDIPARSTHLVELSLQDYEALRDHNRSLAGLALIAASDSDLALAAQRGGDGPLHLRGRLVSANLFRLLGVEPDLGRNLLPEDDRPGAPPVALLSHGLWRRRFGADPGVVGRTLRIDGENVAVVGVLPADVRFPPGVDVWSPLGPYAGMPDLRPLRIFQGIGRLAPGADLAAVRADLDALALRLEKERPASNDGYRLRATPLVAEILGDNRPALVLLLAAVGLLLLLACANVAGLLLARSASRARESAVHAALGAAPGRLVRRVLGESLLVTAFAALLGLLLAAAGLGALARAAPDVPRLDQAGVDGRLLAAGLLAALLTVVLSGLAPALAARRTDLAGALRDGGRVSEGRRSRRLRDLLVVAELALALVLLAGAGLLARSLVGLQSADLGFRPQGLLALRLTLPTAVYREPGDWAAFFRRTLERTAALPGVESTAVVLMRPLSGPIGWDYTFTVEGQTPAEQSANPTANHQRVSPGYFQTLGIPLLAGRDFSWWDGPEAPPVAIVNRATAERFWPGADPLGKRLRWGKPDAPRSPWLTVVGVVGDARYREIEGVRPDLYVPFLQDPHWAMDLVLRAAGPGAPGPSAPGTTGDFSRPGDPALLVPAVRAALAEIDPDQPLARVTTLEQAVADATARPRLRTLLLGLFAVLALLLAAVGLYGLMALAVTERRRELGVRLALGAGAWDLLRLVLGRGLALTAAGLGVGLAAALSAAALAGDILGGLLYQVSPTDLWTFATVPLVLAAAGLAASLAPALRAADSDPLTVLREE
jgi:putative ABC transport system permease protein